MRILLDGVDPRSPSGPNSFARKLFDGLTDLGHSVMYDVSHVFSPPDVRVTFIQAPPVPVPTALRLDGIYFNTRQDWQSMNESIKRSYHAADAIIHQTDFDRRLIESFFGAHQNATVVRNAADPRKTMAHAPLVHPALAGYSQTWASASSWRPHKRLAENIRYFHEHAANDACLVVAGDVSQVADTLKGRNLDRVFFVGNLDAATLTSLYRSATHLIHLAWLDHCPNVVVDARAAGCRIICGSSGGTEEVAGEDAIVVEEDEWDFVPLDLYSPPSLDFSRKRQARHSHLNDMADVAQKYVRVLGGIAR